MRAALFLYSAGLLAQVGGVLPPGARDRQAVVRVTNTSATRPLESLTLSVASAPVWFTNVRLRPEGDGALAPGATRRFFVSFEIAPDAPAGAEETVVFSVSAAGGARLDLPNPSLRIRIPSAAAPAGGATPAAPLLRLVEITRPSGIDVNSQIDFRPSESCFAIRARGEANEIKSYCFEDLPLEIRPGEPFTITVDGKIRRQFPDGHQCGERPAGPPELDYSRFIAARLETSGLESSARGTANLRSYCDEGLVNIDRKEATDKDDAVRLALRFRPAGAAQSAWLYDAQPSTNGLVLSRKLSPPAALFSGRTPELDIRTVENVVLKYRVAPAPPLALARGRHPPEFDSPPRGGGPAILVTAFYVASVKGRGFILNWGGASWAVGGSHDTVLRIPRGDTPAAAVARLRSELETRHCPLQPTHNHPWPQLWESLDVSLKGGPFRTDWDASQTVASAGWVRDSGSGPPLAELARRFGCAPGAAAAAQPPAAAGAAATAGLPGAGSPAGAPAPASSPSAPDPAQPSVAAFIREWISAAEPPENAIEGARMRYNPWGLKIGDSATASIRGAPGRPDDVGARTPEQYVWSQATRLDSVNHCTLDEFVRARLSAAPIESCRGRYRATARAVPDLRGQPAQQAVAALRDIGLSPRLAGGSPAPAPNREFTVENLRPAPGTGVRPGDEVVVLVHSKFEAPGLPNLAGLSLADAEARLVTLGLTARRTGGDPAPSPDLAFKVQSHRPGPGEPAAPGAAVELRVHSAFQAVAPAPAPSPEGGTMPNLVGVEVGTAIRQLGPIRAQVNIRPFYPGATLFRIESQQPPPGTPLTPGTAVSLVWVGMCPTLAGVPPMEAAPRFPYIGSGSDVGALTYSCGYRSGSFTTMDITTGGPRGVGEFNPPCGDTSGPRYPTTVHMVLSGARNVRLLLKDRNYNIRQTGPSQAPLLRDLLRALDVAGKPCQ